MPWGPQGEEECGHAGSVVCQGKQTCSRYCCYLSWVSLGDGCQEAKLSMCMLASSMGCRVVTSTVLSAGATELGRSWREGREIRPVNELSHLNLSQPQAEAILKHRDENGI